MTLEQIKSVVLEFNQCVIQDGSRAAFERLVARGFVNHSAPPGAPSDGESLWRTFQDVLRPALSDLRVTVHQQVAEGDMVTTRKTVLGVHTGPLLGIQPTGRPVHIDVIDMVRVVDGRYTDHWGVNTLPAVLASLRAPAEPVRAE
jgi:predicted ester cyclase